MGLLDGRFTDDPEKNSAISQGLLQMGLQLLQNRGQSFSEALGKSGQVGLQGFQGAQEQQFQQRQRQQQRQQWDDQKKVKALSGQFYKPGAQEALSGAEGAMFPGEMQTGAPSFDWNGYSNALAKFDPMGAMELRQRLAKPVTPLVAVGEGQSLYDPTTKQVVHSGPAKTDKPTSGIQEYNFAVGQGYKGSFQDFELAKRKAGANNVSVNMGQKGLDNTLKVRGDFRSEPIYKAHQEVESAYAQIKQSLKQASPAGDLAGATKLMKLLDPGSVVRESELGMAMAASGALDRLTHYTTNIMNGTKLSPTQRTDFQKLADALYGESVKQYNNKRGEYQGIAQRNGLNEEDVLGRPYAAPSGGIVNFGDLK